MRTKNYSIHDDAPVGVMEETPEAAEWNPNVPFHGTQEEWWEHIRRIEAGNFMSLEEFDSKFNAWKTEYLAKKLR